MEELKKRTELRALALKLRDMANEETMKDSPALRRRLRDALEQVAGENACNMLGLLMIEKGLAQSQKVLREYEKRLMDWGKSIWATRIAKASWPFFKVSNFGDKVTRKACTAYEKGPPGSLLYSPPWFYRIADHFPRWSYDS